MKRALFVLCLVAVTLMGAAGAWGDVLIDATNFPDEGFRKFVLDEFDGDGDKKLKTPDEVKAVTEIEIELEAGQRIFSLQGIEFFSELELLTCSGLSLSALDVSKNKKLKTLNCSNNSLVVLNLNAELEDLNCASNYLKALEVSGCKNLAALNCSTNNITALDVTKNANLTSLWCAQNQIGALDLTKNTNLENLHCENNQIAVLNLRQSTSLELDETVISPQRLSELTPEYVGGKYQVNLANLVGSGNSGLIDKVNGQDSNGSPITVKYDASTGVALFDSQPSTVSYSYDTRAGVSLEVSLGALPLELRIDEWSYLPSGKVGTAYPATTLRARLSSGSEASGVTWSLVSSKGKLPDGLKLSSNGDISGTPTTVGNFTFGVEAKLGPLSDDEMFSIKIEPADLTIKTDKLPDGEVGTAYNATLQASERTGVTWSIVTGDEELKKAGLTLDTSSGIISGTPMTEGTIKLRVKAMNSTSSAEKDFSIKISASSFKITTPSLPSARVGSYYLAELETNDSKGAVPSWRIISGSGSLPPGLTIQQHTSTTKRYCGIINGVPTAQGSFSFKVEAKNGDGKIATADLSINVAAGSSQPNQPGDGDGGGGGCSAGFGALALAALAFVALQRR